MSIEAKKLITLIKLKDESACDLMDYYLDKTEGLNSKHLSTLQKYIDDVCANWAESFICKHQELLNDKQIQIEIFKYLHSIGANKGHTGKRFSEALYKQLYARQNIHRSNTENTL